MDTSPYYTPQSIAPILDSAARTQAPLFSQPTGLSGAIPGIESLAQGGFNAAALQQKKQTVMAAQQGYADYLAKKSSGVQLTPAEEQQGIMYGLSLGISPQAPLAQQLQQSTIAKNEAYVKSLANKPAPISEDQKVKNLAAEAAARRSAIPPKTDDPMKTAKMWQQQMNLIIPTIARRGSPLGIAAVNNQRKDRLLEIAKNPNPTPQEVRLMETDLAGVMQGGSPQEDTLRATHYGSMYQDWANIKGKLTGTPQDAQSPEIVAKLKSLALGVGDVDNKVITNNIAMIEKYPSMTYLIKKDPQGWSNFKQTLMGTLTNGNEDASTQPGAHPQDSQAVQWAKANPNDPRAAKILQLNGQ